MPVKIPDGDFEGRLKQTRSQGSLLPVPTEREGETGRRESQGTRLSLKLSLFLLATLIKDDDDSNENVGKKNEFTFFQT